MRIGDFSKLSLVSIKALRYYDEMGLLKPVSVDQFTGYRHYTVEQLARLGRILALKDLGLSLEQIALVLNEGVSAEQLRGMLHLKRAELRQQIVDAEARLTRIETQLSLITQEDTMSDYNVVLKQVEPQLVAGIRRTIPTYVAIGTLIEELYTYLGEFPIDLSKVVCAALWHDKEYKTSEIDGEAVVYLKQPIASNERVKVYELPGATAASLIYTGAYNQFNLAYAALGHWIEANGYTVIGPNREVYLYSRQPVRQDDASYITEILFPVTR